MSPINIAITLYKVFTARKTVTKTTKQWYQSKGITGNVAAILVTIGGFYGFDIPVNEIENIGAGFLLIYLNGRALLGRFAAETKINGL